MTVFLVGCGHGVSPQMPAGTGTTGLTPLACKTGGVPCSVITSVKEKGFSWRFCRAQLLSECPGSVNCIPAACVRPCIQTHIRRGVRCSLGYPGPLKGPAGVSLLDAVSVAAASPSHHSSEEQRGEML